MKNNFEEEANIFSRYKEEIFKTMEQDTYANHLGIQLIEIKEGMAKAQMTIKDFMLNSHQTVHGAVTFAIADYVFACACNSYGKTAVGLSTTMNFMTAGKPGAQLTAIATEQNKNHKLSWYNIRIESDGELIATMDATAYRKEHYFIPIE
ncbi:hotdog fold thioesterase [Halobacillus rhizosphaerae]|uniref:hotdog fold thioesterase n=1 Tax=Halobacillus rhizosphaerae TaxID=3064889 RepID=UPI00398A6314